MRKGEQTLDSGQGPRPGSMFVQQDLERRHLAAWPQLTLLLVLVARFLPETRLLRIRRKDWRSDFLSDFTRESGPSMAKESLG